MKKTSLAPFALLALSAPACTGTDIGNPDTVDVDFAVYNESFAPAAWVDDGGGKQYANGAIDITDGWLSITAITIQTGAACDVETDLGLTEAIAINLLDNTVNDALADLDLPSANLCSLSFKADGFVGSIPTGAPDELEGSAIVISGSDDENRAFIIASDQDEVIQINARGGQFALSDVANALVIGFSGITLFTDIDLEGATTDAGGIVRITPDENDTLLSTFRDNFSSAARLYDDDDGNGELDEDEHEEEDVLGD